MLLEHLPLFLLSQALVRRGGGNRRNKHKGRSERRRRRQRRRRRKLKTFSINGQQPKNNWLTLVFDKYAFLK